MVRLACLASLALIACTDDSCPPSAAGDRLEVHITSEKAFDRVDVIYEFNTPLPTRTYTMSLTHSYDVEFTSGFHPDLPSMTVVDAYQQDALVGHAEASNYTQWDDYDRFDDGACEWVIAITLPLTPP